MEAAATLEIHGRDRELERMREALERAHGPTAIVIEGDAGIGKTTLLRAGVDLARAGSWRVLSCRPTEPEAQLSFAALGDLLEPVAEQSLPALPGPQARALAVALLLEEPAAASDPRALGVATFGLLRNLAAAGRVLIAIDDCQWLDPGSTGALAYALRRLQTEPVVLLATLRTAHTDPLRLEHAPVTVRYERLTLGSLAVDDLHSVVRSRLQVSVSRPTMLQIHEITAGNPFFAVELVRSLPARAGRVGAHDVPLPRSLLALVEDRVGAFERPVREVLAAAAALAAPSVHVLEAALPAATGALAVAERDGVVRCEDGRIRFTHPLLAGAALETLTSDERARVHRRLAEAVADEEQRARHLAQGVPAPNGAVARRLEAAASAAVERGASRAAAELLEQAVHFTPICEAATSRRRKLEAARQRFAAGDQDRARELFGELRSESAPGPERARVLLDSIAVSEWAARAVALAEEAIAEAGDDGACLADAYRWLAHASVQSGDLASALELARRAARLAEETRDDTSLVACLGTVALLETYRGTITPGLLEQAVELETRGTGRSDAQSPSLNAGLRLMSADRLAESRTILERSLQRAVEEGNEPDRAALLAHLAQLEIRTGNWVRAEEHATTLYELDAQVFGLMERSYFVRSLVSAHLGRVDDVRATLAIDLDEALGVPEATRPFQILNRWVLGFLELSLQRSEQAAELLRPLPAQLERMGYGNPGVRPVLPDAIEALVGVGELEDARRWADRLAEQGRALDNPWAIATAGRCLGLILSAEGDTSSALAAFEQALVEHARSQNPLERARTLLALGTTLRRARSKRRAREVLMEALEAFDLLGAALWAEKASAELARIGGRRASEGGLTPTEQRVAELVAEGRANKEVAAVLFVSVRTVETHIRHVYEKLGVRSRAQLAHRIAKDSHIV